MEVREERSNWRDERISKRHRLWGWDCPVVDIDWLVIEYDSKKPIALVEYKHELAIPGDIEHPSYQAILHLANKADLPFFATRYADDFSWWRITPLNQKARLYIPKQILKATEIEWVEILYKIRNREVPIKIKKELLGILKTDPL